MQSKTKIREGVFETNSSSTHCIVLGISQDLEEFPKESDLRRASLDGIMAFLERHLKNSHTYTLLFYALVMKRHLKRLFPI